MSTPDHTVADLSSPQVTGKSSNAAVETHLRAVTPSVSPWSDSQELMTVFNSIYQNNDSIDNDLHYELLLFAKNKIIIWLTRLHHNMDVAVHLMATKDILDALIADNNARHKDGEDGQPDTDESVVYSLYCVSVIRFCTALSQYSHETNMKSVRRLAHRYSCPQWIIDCRHNLCHSSGNQPSIDELRNASFIALNWLKQYFWIKVLDNLNVNYDTNQNYYDLINAYINSDKKLKKKIKNEMTIAVKYYRNDFITALIQHLISSETTKEKTVNFESLKVPKLYLRKFSNIFAILVKFNSIHILLNLIVKYFDCDNKCQRHLAMCWFSTLVRNIGSDSIASKFKRIFKCLTYKTVMPTIDWVRLLYALVKHPNPMTWALIELIAPIVSDVVSNDKIEILKNLSIRYSSVETHESINQNTGKTKDNNNEEFSVKTVKDLSANVQIIDSDETETDMNEPKDWSQIGFGSSVLSANCQDLDQNMSVE